MKEFVSFFFNEIIIRIEDIAMDKRNTHSTINNCSEQ